MHSRSFPAILARRAHLRPPVGRPPQEGYEKIIELGMHHAESWKYPQRWVLVVVDRSDLQTGQLILLPNDIFLIVGCQMDEMNAEQSLAYDR